MDLAERRASQQRNRESTILIADDDSAILSLLADTLRRHQFAVVTACNGAQALARAQDRGSKIDLLLTDFDMPHMNGMQLVAAIRRFLPRISVVLMSGSLNLEAAPGGDLKLLRKPFTPQVVVETVTSLLEDSHLSGV